MFCIFFPTRSNFFSVLLSNFSLISSQIFHPFSSQYLPLSSAQHYLPFPFGYFLLFFNFGQFFLYAENYLFHSRQFILQYSFYFILQFISWNSFSSANQYCSVLVSSCTDFISFNWAVSPSWSCFTCSPISLITIKIPILIPSTIKIPILTPELFRLRSSCDSRFDVKHSALADTIFKKLRRNFTKYGNSQNHNYEMIKAINIQ